MWVEDEALTGSRYDARVARVLRRPCRQTRSELRAASPSDSGHSASSSSLSLMPLRDEATVSSSSNCFSGSGTRTPLTERAPSKKETSKNARAGRLFLKRTSTNGCKMPMSLASLAAPGSICSAPASRRRARSRALARRGALRRSAQVSATAILARTCNDASPARSAQARASAASCRARIASLVREHRTSAARARHSGKSSS